MNSFRMLLRDTTNCEEIDNVVSFVGEDASGSFGLRANHARFMTRLNFGLARYKTAAAAWQYLAVPGALLYFAGNELTLNTRRFFKSDDYEDISRVLVEVLAVEEQRLQAIKHTLHRIEENVIRHMLDMERHRAQS